KSKYGNVIHETPVTSGPISNYLNNYCFVAMTFEDIPESKDVCGTKPYCQFWFIDELETGRCIGGVKRSEASQLNIFKHELCHNEQAQHDPRLAEHTKAAQSKENINKTYQSLVEGYAELACAQVGGSYYAKHRNLYNSLQTWAGQNRQSGNFELAAKGNWSAFCDLREVYGNGNLKALLVNSGWGGIGSDGSDSYSLDQCKGL
ncbi:MAG: hypothetical protein O3B87_00815, partial [bacterium]|nr:hypothetical protein [bacterium]